MFDTFLSLRTLQIVLGIICFLFTMPEYFLKKEWVERCDKFLVNILFKVYKRIQSIFSYLGMNEFAVIIGYLFCFINIYIHYVYRDLFGFSKTSIFVSAITLATNAVLLTLVRLLGKRLWGERDNIIGGIAICWLILYTFSILYSLIIWYDVIQSERGDMTFLILSISYEQMKYYVAVVWIKFVVFPLLLFFVVLGIIRGLVIIKKSFNRSLILAIGFITGAIAGLIQLFAK